VPVATVQLAVRVDLCGVVSRRVFDDDADSLVHGNELLADAGVPLEAAVEGLRLATAPARVHWKAVVSRAPDLADALAGIPSERMSPAAKQFAKALYRANLTSLSYLLRRMES